MPDSIAARLALLPTLSKTDLHCLWRELFHNQPPGKLRRDLMVPILAYRLQEINFRPLSQSSIRKLSRTVEDIKAHRNASCTGIKPGTRLVRQWQSQTHVVHVEEQGYEYKGSRYDSLSEIARLITGTPRSGPLFFGLREKRVQKSKEAA